MAGKKGLGAGLEGLIGGGTTTPARKSAKEKTTTEDGVVTLKINSVEPNREQPRKNFDEDTLLELSDSIKQVGILSPILVQKRSDYYEIIAGERRWRAAKLAGLKEVPVIIKNLSDQEILEIALIENIQRERLNPIEEAFAYKKLIKEFKLKQDEVAERVSKSRTAVTNSMRLLNLDERVQQMVVDEMITTGHARTLLGIDDKDEQFETANRVFDEKMSVRELEKLVSNLKKKEKDKSKKQAQKIENDFIYEDISKKLSSAIGTKVYVNHKAKGKGKIEIEYYSDEELDRIMQLIISAGGSNAGTETAD